ncbi:hypothetical protein Tco_1128852 [Tanacetum coccineum]|uniref:Uncharacterized protein n=1 Tax=Tanacetum coccineum TaxID=301880 RepID=A0ABQ5GM74_9ASTR
MPSSSSSSFQVSNHQLCHYDLSVRVLTSRKPTTLLGALLFVKIEINQMLRRNVRYGTGLMKNLNLISIGFN